MGAIANVFGYVLNFIYDFVQNYGLAIILFTILLKVLMLPISIKQQSSMKKNAKVQAEMNKLQVKYKNNPEMLNQEVMQLYKREKVSPMSGCLSSILQLVIFLAVFYLVSRPLTYMKKVNPEVISKYQQEITQNGESSSYPEIAIIAKINSQYDEVNARLTGEYKENDEIKEEQTVENVINTTSTEEVENTVATNSSENNEKAENEEEKKSYNDMTEDELKEEKQNLENMKINMSFLGLDLSKVPMQNWQDFKVLIIPILYVIITFVNIKITNNMNKPKKKEEDKVIDVSSDGDGDKEKEETQGDQMESMQQMTKSMTYMMPIMSIAIAIIAPLGLSLYWLVSNCLQLAERLTLNKIFEKKEAKENK